MNYQGSFGNTGALTPDGPQSAECRKWEVSPDVRMYKMSEKCSSWKTVFFGWGGSGERRGGGEGEQGSLYSAVQVLLTSLLICLCMVRKKYLKRLIQDIRFETLS